MIKDHTNLAEELGSSENRAVRESRRNYVKMFCEQIKKLQNSNKWVDQVRAE